MRQKPVETIESANQWPAATLGLLATAALAEHATKKIKTVQKFLDSPKSTSYKADKN